MAKSAKKAMKKPHKFKIACRIYHQPKGKTAEELSAHEFSGCDDIFVATIVHNEEGQSLVDFHSMRGADGKPLTDPEVFQIWGLLANDLSKRKGLHVDTKVFCEKIYKELVAHAAQATGKGLKQ